MENTRKYDICDITIYRSSYANHLRSKSHLENEKQNELVIREWLFKEEQAPIENKTKKVYQPKHIKTDSQR